MVEKVVKLPRQDFHIHHFLTQKLRIVTFIQNSYFSNGYCFTVYQKLCKAKCLTTNCESLHFHTKKLQIVTFKQKSSNTEFFALNLPGNSWDHRKFRGVHTFRKTFWLSIALSESPEQYWSFEKLCGNEASKKRPLKKS